MKIRRIDGEKINLWTPVEVAEWRRWRILDDNSNFTFEDPEYTRKFLKIQKAAKFHGIGTFDSVVYAAFSVTGNVAHNMDFHFPHHVSFYSSIPDWMENNDEAQEKFTTYLVEILMALGWAVSYDPDDKYIVTFLPCLPFTKDELDIEIQSSIHQYASQALDMINRGMRRSKKFYSLNDFKSFDIPSEFFPEVIEELRMKLAPHWDLEWEGRFPSGYRVISVKVK